VLLAKLSPEKLNVLVGHLLDLAGVLALRNDPGQGDANRLWSALGLNQSSLQLGCLDFCQVELLDDPQEQPAWNVFLGPTESPSLTAVFGMLEDDMGAFGTDLLPSRRFDARDDL
jgi:hypothetical protein